MELKMTLKEWLKKEGRTLIWLANTTDIKMQRLSGISTGRIEPRLIEAAEIYNLTGGDVTVHDHLATIKEWRAKNAK
jgi:hypothetical protein